MAQAGPVLALHKLNVFYGASQVLFDLSLELHAGQTVALLGRNGAGKSTTMKAIAGILAPARGSIYLAGDAIAGTRPHRAARLGLAYVPEDRQVFPEHTVEDNLIVAAKKGPAGEDGWTVPRIWEVFPTLATMRGRQAGRLSGGEQQMLAIARALMGNPRVILLDEPSEGLAPQVVARIGQLIRLLRSLGVTILIAEQNMHFCLGIATGAAVIDRGQIVYCASIEALRGNDDVRRRYLAI